DGNLGNSLLSAGYASEFGIGSKTPAGVAIIDLHQNNVLVSETGVPAVQPITSGRIYAEVGGAVNTGLAIANPNSSAATVTFYFTDVNGNSAGSGSTSIAANQQIAIFLNQAPFNVFTGAT